MGQEFKIVNLDAGKNCWYKNKITSSKKKGLVHYVVANVQCHSIEELVVKDRVCCNHIVMTIDKILQRRDCKGRFENPSEAINSFYELECSYEYVQKSE